MGAEAGLEKRKPHYALAHIKAAFADAGSLNRSFVSKQGADDLDMDDNAVVTVIQGLSQRDFEKSMTSMNVKFTLDAQQAPLLISFKEA
jgi:Motility quorum-sensing regulator, toxin of MqsA